MPSARDSATPARGKRYWDVVPALLRERSLVISGIGQVTYGGRFLSVCRFFDRCLRNLARRYHADEHSYPALIPVETLRQLEYFASFPQFATFATHFKDRAAASGSAAVAGRPGRGLAEPRHVLSPAVCYHTYAFLRGRTLARPQWCVTAAERCFRFEGGTMRRTPERLWNFTMRELVFFGATVEVERRRRRLVTSVRRLAAATGIAADMVEAHDAFFLGASRGKRLLQKLKKLKFELRAGIRDGRTVAIASFNHHEDFFGSRMNIRLPGGTIASSGCAAFGIERWAYAFLCQNGPEVARWPPRVRRWMLRHEAR
jgi:seryl-tRNA synthetase